MYAEKAKEFGSIITRLIQSQNITRNEAKAVFSEILRNEPSPMNQGAFLAALAAKGETAEEIAGSWEKGAGPADRRADSYGKRSGIKKKRRLL